MTIALIKKHQNAYQEMGGLYMGQRWIYDLYACHHKDTIGIGKSRTEAIRNCLEAIKK